MATIDDYHGEALPFGAFTGGSRTDRHGDALFVTFTGSERADRAWKCMAMRGSDPAKRCRQVHVDERRCQGVKSWSSPKDRLIREVEAAVLEKRRFQQPDLLVWTGHQGIFSIGLHVGIPLAKLLRVSKIIHWLPNRDPKRVQPDQSCNADGLP